ncbi:DUF3558 family protein [Umezawaea sp. Da 62-37]|uniref:DUF3558 family protein n=1 Tax=Umezawaea sp. Da 62-37 TaxID=3075927 RepID=UPI0028F6DE06|nr:DUF3558 family protein [Umezawaea sp. Da 62-37]WNV82080.1 DUF3558 family protein [Umezawaea sp. Da 62-37]
MTARRVLLLVAVLVAATGCSSGTGGTPRRAAVTSVSPDSVRPQAIDLAGKQRCLLDRADWAAFAIEEDGEVTHRDKDPKGVDCGYFTALGYFGFLFNTTDGVGYWTRSPSAEAVAPVAPVRGYPAFERANGPDKGRCDLILDVAEGQALDVYASIDAASTAKLPPKCETARKLAELAITALSR